MQMIGVTDAVTKVMGAERGIEQLQIQRDTDYRRGNGSIVNMYESPSIMPA